MELAHVRQLPGFRRCHDRHAQGAGGAGGRRRADRRRARAAVDDGPVRRHRPAGRRGDRRRSRGDRRRSRACSTPASASCTRRSSRVGAAVCSWTSTTPAQIVKKRLAARQPAARRVAARRRRRTSPSASPRARRSTPRCGCRRSPAGSRCPLAVACADLPRAGRAPGQGPAAGDRDDRSRLVATGVVHFALLVRRRQPRRQPRRRRPRAHGACAPCSGAPPTSSTCRPRSSSRSARCSRSPPPTPARDRSAPAWGPSSTPCAGVLGQPLWRALACLAAIAAGLLRHALAGGDDRHHDPPRRRSSGSSLGAIGLLDVLGSVDWAHDGSARVQRTARRLAIGVTAGDRRGERRRCCSAAWRSSGPCGRRTSAHADMAVGRLQRHLELCDRRLDEVVFAGTHNSMAASARGLPRSPARRRHRGPAGERACGRSSSTSTTAGAAAIVVRTDLRSESDEEALPMRSSPEERGRDRGRPGLSSACPRTTERTVYLCHVYCELGATPAVDAFRGIHDFLRENPNEVIVLVLEDFVDAGRRDAGARARRPRPAGAGRGRRASRCRRWAR